MKKMLTMTLTCLLLLCLCASALANDKGMRGGLYDIVADDDDYDDYFARADDGSKKVNGRHVNHALLVSRYHAQLLSGSRVGKVWQLDTASTTAVYQPGDERGESPELEHLDDGFILRYGEREYYVFSDIDGEYVLTEARFKQDEEYSDSLLYEGDSYLLWESGPMGAPEPIGDARWFVDAVTLDEINITLLPRTLTDVRRMTDVHNAMSDAPLLEMALLWQGMRGGSKLPVYSAPDADSYRASSGKAAVSMGDEIRVYGTVGEWTLISYDVSLRTSRFGFVQGNFAANQLQLGQVSLITDCDTYMTDDPFVSQYAQAYIPAGTRLTGLMQVNDYYVYAAWEGEGKTMWGFVPARDLQAEFDRSLDTGDVWRHEGVDWALMDLMVGKWVPVNGHDGKTDMLVIYTGGMYMTYTRAGGMMTLMDGGNVRIRELTEDAEVYPASEYALWFMNEVSQITQLGLQVNEDGTITLYDQDGNGVTYQRREYSTYGNG